MLSYLTDRHKRLKVATVLIAASLFLYIRKKSRRERLRKSAVVDGRVLPGFENVRKKCLENIFREKDHGMQVCCYHRGEPVVDISGGPSTTNRMFPESLSVIFSCSKVMESLVISILVDRGLLDYDDPVAKHWPEFGEHICDKLTVKDLMRHQSGLSGVVEPIPLSVIDDPASLERALLQQKCFFNPYDENDQALFDAEREREHLLKTAHIDGFTSNVKSGTRRQAYNAVTRGFYSATLVRKVDPKSRTIDQFFEEEIAINFAEMNGRDCYIGCPQSEQARCINPTEENALSALLRIASHFFLPKQVVHFLYDDFGRLFEYEKLVIKNLFYTHRRKLALQAYLTVKGSFSPTVIAGDSKVRAVPMASVTTVANARSMACIMSQVASCGSDFESVKLLSEKGLQRGLETEGALVDEILARPVTYTAAGWGADRFEFVGCEGWYGWAGLGGSMLLFNPATKSSFAYVPSHLGKRLYKPRGISYLKEFMASIEKVEKQQS